MRVCFPVLIAATLTLGACADLSALQSLAPVPQAQATKGVPIQGTVKVPAGILQGAPAAGYRQVLALSQTPLVNAEVFLADAGGNPVPNLASTTTDAQGKYAFPDVPEGYTFLVVAKGKTKDGKEALFQTLTKANGLGATADIDAASTLVTASVAEGLGSSLGQFNPATFKTATEETGKRLESEKDLPDFSSRAALVAKMNALAKDVEVLRVALDEMKKDLKDIKASLEDLKTQIKQQPKAEVRPHYPQGGPPPSMGGCEEMFKKGDTNQDGAIAFQEALALFGGPPQGAQPDMTIFKNKDTNGDGALSPEEFCKPGGPEQGAPRPSYPQPGTGGYPPPDGMPSCEDRLRMNDINQDGIVDPSEWEKTFRARASEPNAPAPSPLEIFKHIDRDQDGKLSAAELCAPPPSRPTQTEPSTPPSPVACTEPREHTFYLTRIYEADLYPLTVEFGVPGTHQINTKATFHSPAGEGPATLPEGCAHDLTLRDKDGNTIASATQFSVKEGEPAEIKLPF